MSKKVNSTEPTFWKMSHFIVQSQHLPGRTGQNHKTLSEQLTYRSKIKPGISQTRNMSANYSTTLGDLPLICGILMMWGVHYLLVLLLLLLLLLLLFWRRWLLTWALVLSHSCLAGWRDSTTATSIRLYSLHNFRTRPDGISCNISCWIVDPYICPHI